MVENSSPGLLVGAFDLHIHSSPDVVARKLTDIALAKAARAAGLAGILIKCHHSPTTARAALASEAVPGILVFGGLVLNRQAGGLNQAAVAAELALGAKEIWLPTLSAANHIRLKGGDPAQAVPVFAEDGRLRPELPPIFEMIAKSGAILGTGHLSPAETEAVVVAAQDCGVAKILVTHPEFEVTAMPLEQQKRLAARGVFFERCFFASNAEQRLPPAELARQIKTVGVETTILASDFGQAANDPPPEGFRRLLAHMQQSGFTAADLDIMTRQNPRRLLGI